MYDCITAKLSEKNIDDLRTFSNKIYDNFGCWKTAVTNNDWTIDRAKFFVGTDGHRSLLGRDFSDKLEFSSHNNY